MNTTITHKPLNQEEITALGEPLRRIVGTNWAILFLTTFLVAVVTFENRYNDSSLLALIIILAVYFIFLLPLFLNRKSMKADLVLKLLSETPLFPVEHQIHFSDEAFSVNLPDYQCTCRYDMIPQIYLTHVPSTGDELLLLVLPSFPIIRKSDFESAADFTELFDKLQAERTRKKS